MAVKNGTLYRWNPNCVTVVRPWGHTAGAWRLHRKTGIWRAFTPQVDFRDNRAIPPVSLYRRDQHGQIYLPLGDWSKAPRHRLAGKYAMLFKTIPDNARRLAACYRHDEGQQWRILQFLNRVGRPAEELAASNPGLAFAIAINRLLRQNSHPMRSARRLARIKRRQACEWLGFPDNEQAVRILSRVPPWALSIRFVHNLAMIMHNRRSLDMLSHCRSINTGVIQLLTSSLIPHVGHRLLLSVSDDPHETNDYPTAKRIQQTVQLFDNVQWEDDEVSDEPIVFHSRRQIERLYKIAMDCLTYNLQHSCFPPPPLRTVHGIHALSSAREVIREGIEQQNCLQQASAIMPVSIGDFYYYRTVPPPAPQRCTVLIQRDGSRWGLAEMKAAHNAEPAQNTKAFVLAWLARVQAGIGHCVSAGKAV